MKSGTGTQAFLLSMGLYAAAFFLTQLLHELGHAVAGVLVGAGPVLHTTFVEHTQALSTDAHLITALSGPAVSLAQGLLFLALLRLRVPSPVKLGMIWMSYHGLTHVVGSLFAGAFASEDALGKVWGLLEVPSLAQWAICAASLAGFFFLTRLYLTAFRDLSARRMRDARKARRWAKLVGLYPGLAATAMLAVVSLPLPHEISYVYVATACLPLVSFPETFSRVRLENPVTSWRASKQEAVRGLLGYLLLHLLGRLLLDGGVAL